MKVCAIVVTYNRLALLKECVNGLRNQSHSLDEIIVVNNDSTDGTKDWLDIQTDLTVIHQANLGGAGGFYCGSRYAVNRGYDWIWMMDDDVEPTVDCLKELLDNASLGADILQPLRKYHDQEILLESKLLNLTNPFKDLHQEILSKSDLNSVIKVQAIPFEGPLIRGTLFQEIGFPNKDLFIFYDDTDFSYRTISKGGEILFIPEAILEKKLLPVAEKEFLSWKKKYSLRNSAFFDKSYGCNWWVRNIRPYYRTVRYILLSIRLRRNVTIKGIIEVFRYTTLGLKRKLGKI